MRVLVMRVRRVGVMVDEIMAEDGDVGVAYKGDHSGGHASGGDVMADEVKALLRTDGEVKRVAVMEVELLLVLFVMVVVVVAVVGGDTVH